MLDRSTSLTFELNRHLITADEQRILTADIAAQGLDDRYWAAMNGLLATGSRSDTPLVLRARRGAHLAGLACLLECRRTNQCLFPGRLGRMLDLVPTPAYYWTRGDAAVDLLGCPGFVVPGEDRHEFYRAALAYLDRRYLSGIVVEPRDYAPGGACYETPMMNWGRYVVRPGGLESVIGAHKNLRRKTSVYRKKGGTIEIVEGALRDADLDRVLHCLEQSTRSAPLRAPFQENYGNMVRWASTSGTPGIVHVLARLGGELVGYHSYLRSGTRLQCLSGAFDRTRATTHHAYENILLETMRYAESIDVAEVAFGPIGNPTKASVMPEAVPYVARFYSRHAALRRLMAFLIPRSALRPSALPLAEPHGVDVQPSAPARPLAQL